ncbi:uncharacterized protein LOC143903257 [Temnothorax americanus]|uniref:uncharacterized protein LOC143903257 n=1 Tax=Temnothorax americanus TaxID=1964332 RepID=UPI004068053D
MKTWSMFDITVIKYCSSLASARKSAADSYYDTTDEEKFGRGQRTLKKNSNKHILHEIEENDDDDDLDDEGNNKENDDNSNERNKKSSKHLKQSINRPTLNPMPTYDPEKAENLRQSVNTCTTKKICIFLLLLKILKLKF